MFNEIVRARPSKHLRSLCVLCLAALALAPRADAQTLAGLDIQTYAGLDITGAVGTVYSVEYSTNRVDWEVVSVSTVNENGSFEDTEAAMPECRFYRVVNPTSAP